VNKSIENQIISRIYGNGRGWAFSIIDFTPLGSRNAIDVSLHRLHTQGTIRRVIRGIYDYPKYSELLRQDLSPDIDQVAAALARKFGWYIQVTGPTALNYLGLSTQVPGRYIYVSNGPKRKYAIGKRTLEFEHKALKESSFKLRESPILVQAIKSLGEENMSDETIQKIREWLEPKIRKPLLKDTRTATGWVYKIITSICKEEDHGSRS
jgi:hypothetical protein